ncbi:MAG TPA: hypothetical protein VGJ82_23235 [Thermoanaerobaculia bacterium]|jgi:hypothetical protein
MSTRTQAGRTAGETLFAIIVFASLAVAAYVLLRPKAPDQTEQPVQRKSPYKTLTNADGLIPLKAVIVPRNGAVVFSSPADSSATAERLPMFETYFPLHQNGGFVELTNDPMSDKPVGWVRSKSVLLWTTREALRPNRQNTDRHPLRLWTRLSDVGHGQPEYEEDLDADPPRPYPVLDRSGRSYEIAMTWQSSDFSDAGVDTAWTGPLDVPDDARFYYLTTRSELQRHFEEMTAALNDLASGQHAKNPVVALLKGNVALAAGDKIDSDTDDVGVLQKILSDLRNPLKIAKMQSSEIHRESANMKRQLDRLRHFYLNSDNFNSRGIAWVPAEDLPGN